MIYAAAIIIWGAIAVIGAGALAIMVGSPLALAMVVIAAGATYLFQIIEANREHQGGDFMPTELDQFVQLFLFLAVVTLFALSIVWSIGVHYGS